MLKKNTGMTTNKVKEILSKGVLNKREVSDELGISRPALDKKLNGTTSWKKLEVYWIDRLYDLKIKR